MTTQPPRPELAHLRADAYPDRDGAAQSVIHMIRNTIAELPDLPERVAVECRNALTLMDAARAAASVRLVAITSRPRLLECAALANAAVAALQRTQQTYRDADVAVARAERARAAASKVMTKEPTP